MSLPEITLDCIKENTEGNSYRRGEEYYESGMVTSVTRRGSMIYAEVEGSEDEPYQITITSGESNSLQADCTCAYAYGGWCKHIVAAMLLVLNEPGQVENKVSIETLLEPLSREELQHLVRRLVLREPSLADALENEITLLKRSGDQAAVVKPLLRIAPIIDPGHFRQQVKTAIRQIGEYDRYGGYDEETDYVSQEIAELVGEARQCIEAEDSNSALAALEALTDEYAKGWKKLEDYYEPDEEMLEDLNGAWAEALLSAPLTEQERAYWTEKLQQWQRKMGGTIREGILDCAITAAQQGWDAPHLVKALQGEISRKGAWEGEAPIYAETLTLARLSILERQGRLQEYIHLAEAEGQTRLYLVMLVKTGRIEEAVKEGLAQAVTTEEAFALAQVLQEKGALQEALRIGEHGLKQQGQKYQLALWLRDLAAEQNNRALAIKAGSAAVEADPRLEDYRALEKLAGESWTEIREKMLAAVRLQQGWNLSGKVDILLYEQLIDEAIDAVQTNYGGDGLLGKVMDAAVATRPEKVIAICKPLAESIMDAGKSNHYTEAAHWLKKVRAAYQTLQNLAEWKTYHGGLLLKHTRKSALVPRLKEIA